jgi:two-component system phosphate regulon sensor histidine kinase PhoR
MPGRDIPWRAILAATPAAAAPTAAILFAFWALGVVDAGTFAFGLALALLAGLGLAWRRERALAAMVRYIDALADGTAEAQLPAIDGLEGPMRRLAARWAQREARLSSTAAAHRRVLDLLPDPLMQLAPGPVVVAANRAAVEVLGADLAGRNIETVLRSPAVLEAVEEVMAGAKRRDVEFTLASPVAREFLCRVAALPERAADGTVAVLTFSDLTAAKRMEEMRADFVANASHEIRTPLAALAGYIETLRGPARDDAKARERFLGIMADQVTRMTRLVSDLLSLSRIELHEHTAPSDAVDVGAILARVARSLEWKAGRKEMRIALDVPPGLKPALGDASEIEQVFQNLLDNAIKYGGQGTEVRVAARPAERGPRGMPSSASAGIISVAVADQGAGIAREHLPRLTERFYRVDAARSRDMGGTGLGLAIVKHIVNRHRGVLTIESEPGKGSTFTVHLPASDQRLEGHGEADGEGDGEARTVAPDVIEP